MTIDINAPVTEATVLEDRANVIRAARVTLPAGRSVLRIAGIAPVLADKTAIATIDGPAHATVNRLAITRQRVILDADRPANEAELRARAHAMKQEGALLQDKQQRTATARDKIAAAISATITEANDDAAWGRDGTAGWRAALDDLHARERDLALQVVAINQDITDLNHRARDLFEHSHHSPTRPPLTATIAIDVDVAEAGDYNLRLAYLVPNACWRPYHAARLIDADSAGKTQVEFTTTACIWQNTGEDWTGIRLRVSTARPSLGTSPPELSSDRLTLRRKDHGIQVEVREQTMQNTGGAVDGTVQASDGGGDVLGIDDGGEPQILACPGTATIPSDGLSHRVPLSGFTAPSESALIVMGEMTPAAILRSTQTNRSQKPLLAGPVDLIRQGGLAGRADILYVAPGAAFDLGWGPEGDLRIERETTEIDDKGTVSSFFSGWTSTLMRVEIRVSNLSDGARSVVVHERIPVSSLDQVRIETDTVTPPATPDADGFLRWTLALPARSHREIVLRYRIRRHPDVTGV